MIAMLTHPFSSFTTWRGGSNQQSRCKNREKKKHLCLSWGQRCGQKKTWWHRLRGGGPSVGGGGRSSGNQTPPPGGAGRRIACEGWRANVSQVHATPHQTQMGGFSPAAGVTVLRRGPAVGPVSPWAPRPVSLTHTRRSAVTGPPPPSLSGGSSVHGHKPTDLNPCHRTRGCECQCKLSSVDGGYLHSTEHTFVHPGTQNTRNGRQRRYPPPACALPPPPTERGGGRGPGPRRPRRSGARGCRPPGGPPPAPPPTPPPRTPRIPGPLAP